MLWVTRLIGGPKRVNHAAVAIGHKIYSFGGYSTGENEKDYSSMDVHVLNTLTYRWTKHPVSDLNYFENDDVMPFKRYGHTAVCYKDKVYVWGGRNDWATDSSLFCFDPVWHCWTSPRTTGALPLARDGHSACVWNQYMIIYGGYEEATDNFASTIHILDLETMEWSIMTVRGNDEPKLRDFHTTVCLGDRMYMFGGRAASNRTETYPNTMWYLDLPKKIWVCVDAKGPLPIGRRSHSSFIREGNIYVFGGYNAVEQRHFDDFYEFNVKTNTWRLIQPLGRGPCPRRRQVALVVDQRLFLFGGTSPMIPFDTHDEDALTDHCDLFVLDFKCTLKTLCLMATKEYNLNSSFLPETLRSEIENISTPNKITVYRPTNSLG